MFKIILPKLKLKVEKWKWNKEYRIYVSNFGNFKDEYKNNIPVKISSVGGYVVIKTNYGYTFAHRLVMLTWKPIPNAENLTVDHLDHNKRRNTLDNLEWVTRKENILRAKRDFITSSIKDEDKEENMLKAKRNLITSSIKDENIGKNNFKISFQKGNKRGVILNSLEDAIQFVYKEQGLLSQRCDNIPRKDRVKNKILDAIKNQTEYCGGKWKLV